MSLSLPCSQDDPVWHVSAECVPGSLQSVKLLPPLFVWLRVSHYVGQAGFRLTETCLLSAALPDSTQLLYFKWGLAAGGMVP